MCDLGSFVAGTRMKVGSVLSVILVGILIVASIPLVARASGPVNDNLKNGGFEPIAGADQGYALRGTAAPSALARSGSQSIDLGSSGAAVNNVLAGVQAFPKAHVPLKQLTSLSFWYSVPNAPASAIYLQQFTTFDLNSDSTVDVCLIGDIGSPLSQTAGYQSVVVDEATTLQVADATCTVTSGSSSLSALKSDPSWSNAKLVAAYLQTLTTLPTWPAGFAVRVDDFAVLASFSTLVRIANEAHNLCDGASFANIPDALSCATSGATILVAPGSHAGGFSVTADDVTICSTTSGGVACDDQPASTRIRGGGMTPIVVEANGVTIRGFTVDNPDYNGVGVSSEPALIYVLGNGVSVLNNVLRDPAAPLGPQQSRASVRGIYYDDAAYTGLVSGNTITAMGSATNVDGSCAQPPCRTMSIQAGGTQIRVENNVIDGTDSRSPYYGIYVDDLGEARGNTITLPTRQGASGFGAPAGSVLVTIENNRVTQTNNVDKLADGLRGSFSFAIIRDNWFDTLASGVTLEPEGQGNQIEDNWFGNVTSGVVLAWYGAASLSENTFRSYARTLTLTPDADGMPVDARSNDWGEYSRLAILETIDDQGEPTFVDVECYLQANLVTHACGPTAAYTFVPGTLKEDTQVNFTDASVAGAHTLTQRSWDFGDGTTSNSLNPKKTFANPGPYLVSLTVRDADGFEDTYAEVLFVQPIDHAPVMAAVADLRLVEGSSASRWVNATDEDGHAMVMTVTNLPSWATFSDLGGGKSLIVASPPAGSIGTYPVRVTATANGKEASSVFNITVLRDAKFTMALVGAAARDASGNENVTLEADVTNTGNATDSYSFTATGPAGWTLTLPGTIAVAPGATARVSLHALAPALAGNGVVKLTARSVGNPNVNASTQWNVRVEAFVTVAMDDVAPTPAEEVSGVVRVVYKDGSPAVGALVTVKQTSRATGLSSTLVGLTDASGEFAFNFGQDAASRLPGTHVVTASVRVVQSFVGQTTYDTLVPL